MGARRAITFDQWKASGGYVDPETVHFRKRIAAGFDPKPLFPPDFNSKVVEIARKRMAAVDGMSPEMRGVVHEYGDAVVKAFLQQGIKSPGAIRHLISIARGSWPDGRNATASNPKPGQRSGS